MTSKPDFPTSPPVRVAPYSRAMLLFVFVLGLIAIMWRFGSWMPEVFSGDDLFNLLAYKDGSFPGSVSEALTVAFLEKYRPVFIWLTAVMFGAFDARIESYMAVNVLLHALNAAIVFAIAKRLSQGNLLVAVAAALATATSRFAFYQVTQVTGFLEGIALTFFLVMIYCMARTGDEAKEAAWRWSWLALVAAFLVINTHERYIVVAPWLCLALVVLPGTRALPRARLLALLGGCAAIVLFNVVFKVAVLQMPFFVGTGGTHMDFDVLRVFDLVRQAVLSIFAFNEGPEYLVGIRAISLEWFPVWLLAALFTLAWLLAVATGIHNAFVQKIAASASRWQALGWPLLLLVLGGLVLGPPALTIRMEQRWVLAPFILTLLLFAWAAGVQRQRAFVPVWMLAVAIGASTVVSDTIIAAHFDQIFFATSGRFATAAKRDIVDKAVGQSGPVALFSSADNCNWTLLNGEFFRLYGGVRRTAFCFDSIDAAKAAGLPKNTPIYSLDTSSLALVDVSSELLQLFPSGETVTHDFLALFPEGTISDPREVSSPSGTGVITMPWDTFLGHRNSLTVVSGFSYSYDAVTIERDTYLRFGIAMAFPSQESVKALVRIQETGAEPRVIYSQELVPPRAGEKLLFEPISIALAEFADKKVSVTFIAETPPERDNSGHWVIFAEPRIVIDAAP